MKARGEDYKSIKIKSKDNILSNSLPVKDKITGEELVLIEKSSLNFGSGSNGELGGTGRVSTIQDLYENAFISDSFYCTLKKSLEKTINNPEYVDQFCVTEAISDLNVDPGVFSSSNLLDNENLTVQDINSLIKGKYLPNGDELILLGQESLVSDTDTFSIPFNNAIENYDDEEVDFNLNENLLSLTSNMIDVNCKILDRVGNFDWIVILELDVESISENNLNKIVRFDKSVNKFSAVSSEKYKGFIFSKSLDFPNIEQSEIYTWDHLSGKIPFKLSNVKFCDTIYVWYVYSLGLSVPVAKFNFSDFVDSNTPSSYKGFDEEFCIFSISNLSSNQTIQQINIRGKMKWLDKDLVINKFEAINFNKNFYVKKKSSLYDNVFVIDEVMIWNSRVHQLGVSYGTSIYGNFIPVNSMNENVDKFEDFSFSDNEIFIVCKGHTTDNIDKKLISILPLSVKETQTEYDQKSTEYSVTTNNLVKVVIQ